MRILVFDTETTGLPETRIINPETLNLWPHIVQFSYVIYDTDLNNIVDVRDYIIKTPTHVVISEESIKLHGITKEKSTKLGLDIVDILKEFFYYLKTCDKFVGHNISFDINMLKVELLRLIYADESDKPSDEITYYKKCLYFLTNYKNICCTLKDSIQLCNIEAVDRFGKKYLKYPKLIELHQKLFGFDQNNLHNSLVDILVTLRCFMKINYDIDLGKTCDEFKGIMNTLNNKD
jgi:DNA polymerase III epsilon subunit-like protein